MGNRAKQGTFGPADLWKYPWWRNRDPTYDKSRAIDSYIQALHLYNTAQKHLRESRETPAARTDREFREGLKHATGATEVWGSESVNGKTGSVD